MLKKIFQKILAMGLLLLFLGFGVLPAQAAGPIEPTGTVAPTGVVEPTGPIEPTGVIEPTGPIETQEPLDNTPVDTNLPPPELSPDGPPPIVLSPTQNQSGQTNDTNNTGGVTLEKTASNEATDNVQNAGTLVDTTNSQLGEGSSIGSQNINADGKDLLLLAPAVQRVFLDSVLGNTSGLKIVDKNQADINNEVDFAVNTGKNTLQNNTYAGDFTTGDIDLIINLLNLANLQLPNLLLYADIWNILGNFNGDIAMQNTTTGPDSKNLNEAAIENNFRADLAQNADISNLLDIQTNTGGNKIGNNTIVGGLETGSTTINTSITNLANITDLPMFYIFNVYGAWNGTVTGLDPSMYALNFNNEQTGPSSINQNQTNISNTADLAITNDANAQNKISIQANTGDNTIANNTVVGKIKTGAINISANVINVLNAFSDKTGKFILGIINIFGQPPTATAESEKPAEKEKPSGGKGGGKEESVINEETMTENIINEPGAMISRGGGIEAAELPTAGADNQILTTETAPQKLSAAFWIILALAGVLTSGWLILELLTKKQTINK